MNRLLSLLSLALLLALGCESDPGESVQAREPDTSGNLGDVAEADLHGDEPDVVEDVATETEVADIVEADAPWPDLPDPPLPDEPCPAPPVGDAPPMGRWSLSMFHYNIQYVAGGTEDFGLITAGPGGNIEGMELTAIEVENRIVTESVVPVLGILERNPELALTFEMQGYMVDVIAERHPRTLRRMRALVESGQLELVSIHWSDQFFLAFGRAEMDESWARTQASFEAAGLELSPVVFTQEGQFGEGFAEWLHENRPDAIMVMARNLQGFFQDDLVDQPLWDVEGVDVVLPRGLSDERVDRQWSFFDDGELLSTNDMNPYLGVLFAYHPQSTGRYEHRLKCEAENGYQVGRVSDYAAAVRDAGFEPQELPPFLDGTWQPRSTTGPLRWMGGAGDLWSKHERDNLVLTTCVWARHNVLALDTLVKTLGENASRSQRGSLDEAWRNLLLGQVSDSRGVNPWWGEVQYGLTHCDAARDIASAELLWEVERRSVDALVFDTLTRSVFEPLGTGDFTGDPADPPISITVVEDGGREPSLDWYRWGEDDDNLWFLDVTWPPVPGADTAFESCMESSGDLEWRCSKTPVPVAIEIPREPGLISYRPALSERLVQYQESDFVLQDKAYEEGVWSTVADGLVGLGTGYLVKDLMTVHLAVGWPPGEGENDVIQIRDEVFQPWDSTVWRFYYTENEANAIDLAQMNLFPNLLVRSRD